MKITINFWWFLAAQVVLLVLQYMQITTLSTLWMFSPIIAYFIFSWLGMRLAIWGLNKSIKNGQLKVSPGSHIQIINR
jgi:hypothetical protein